MERTVRIMSEKIYMRAEEVAEELGVSQAFAYRVIKQLNSELESKGFIVINGRVDRKYFHDRMYATHERGVNSGSV